MAIRLIPVRTESRRFCLSKFLGDPDMPADMHYPMVIVEENNEKYEYPLNFLCQIDCVDIAPYDKEGILPQEGMFYFFSTFEYFLGYDTPVRIPVGEWPKGYTVVKYTKSINPETFQSFVMTDDEDQPLSHPPFAIEFSICDDDESGLKLLGKSSNKDVTTDYHDHINFLQLATDSLLGLDLKEEGLINILIKPSDIQYGNWKLTRTHLFYK